MKPVEMVLSWGIVILLLFSLVGCSNAGSTGVSIVGNGHASLLESMSASGASASVEKKLDYAVSGPNGKFSQKTSGPLSATSKDGSIRVSVNALQMGISGKTTGDGYAKGTAIIKAEGNRDGAGNLTVMATINSTVEIGGGSYGTAQARASSQGSASATGTSDLPDIGPVVVRANAVGSTTTSASVDGGSGQIVDGRGYIVSTASVVPSASTTRSDIASYVYGQQNAKSSASASGTTTAIIDNGFYTIGSGVSGSTSAAGTSWDSAQAAEFGSTGALVSHGQWLGSGPFTNTVIQAFSTTTADEGGNASATAMAKTPAIGGNYGVLRGSHSDDLRPRWESTVSGVAHATSGQVNNGSTTARTMIEAVSRTVPRPMDVITDDDGIEFAIRGDIVNTAQIVSTTEVEGNSKAFIGSASTSGRGTPRTEVFDQTVFWKDINLVTTEYGTVRSQTGPVTGEGSVADRDARVSADVGHKYSLGGLFFP